MFEESRTLSNHLSECQISCSFFQAGSICNCCLVWRQMLLPLFDVIRYKVKLCGNITLFPIVEAKFVSYEVFPPPSDNSHLLITG